MSNFFLKISPRHSTLKVARDLLGKLLVHDSAEGKTVGRIVETEAYLSNDPACHASRGLTPRNAPMFEEAGIAYVYFIYGMYHCFNVVTGKKGRGEAVLIRALEPVEGIPLMFKRRPKAKLDRDLCSGPGKLVMAMGIEKEHNKHRLHEGPLYLLNEGKIKKKDVVTTTRIGIVEGANLPYRFYIKDNKYISKK
ncbi:DNA-3-methyladenine glycosylase [bacterium]|nr:DNA-3-methyladenine glycosylase [bacterium]